MRCVPSEIPPETDAVLRAFDWPGNVRELQNVLQRAIVMSEDEWILPSALAGSLPSRGPQRLPAEPAADVREESASRESPNTGTEPWDRMLQGLTLDDVLGRAMESAVRRNGGNRTRAAEDLAISRTTLYRRLGPE